MRILLLKSLLLCTNCPSFLPILCGILFVFAVESFWFLSWICFCHGILIVFVVDLFLPWICFCRRFLLFLPWICFCRGFLLFLLWIPLCIFLLSFCFSLFFSRSFYYLPRNPKNVGVFLEKVHRFLENLHRFFVFLGDVAKLSCFQMCL